MTELSIVIIIKKKMQVRHKVSENNINEKTK